MSDETLDKLIVGVKFVVLVVGIVVITVKVAPEVLMAFVVLSGFYLLTLGGK